MLGGLLALVASHELHQLNRVESFALLVQNAARRLLQVLHELLVDDVGDGARFQVREQLQVVLAQN